MENRRCQGERIVQQTVLYLGEINDSQRAQWIRAIEVFDEDRGALEQIKLFTAERPLPEAASDGVQVRLQEFELHRPRQWGACWLFSELWKNCGSKSFGVPGWDAARGHRLGACAPEPLLLPVAVFDPRVFLILQVVTVLLAAEPGSRVVRGR